MKNKVLFLDIDSVLNSHEEWKIAGKAVHTNTYHEVEHIVHVYDKPLKCPISRVVGVDKLKRLKEIVSVTDCDIVGISSWFNNMEDIKQFHKDTNLNLCDIGYVPCGGSYRYDGVLKYLKDHPQYTNAVILDDIPFMTCGLDNIHVCPSDKDGLDDINNGMMLSFRSAYIGFHTDPCIYNQFFIIQIEKINEEQRRLRALKMQILGYIEMIKNNNNYPTQLAKLYNELVEKIGSTDIKANNDSVVEAIHSSTDAAKELMEND